MNSSTRNQVTENVEKTDAAEARPADQADDRVVVVSEDDTTAEGTESGDATLRIRSSSVPDGSWSPSDTPGGGPTRPASKPSGPSGTTGTSRVTPSGRTPASGARPTPASSGTSSTTSSTPSGPAASARTGTSSRPGSGTSGPGAGTSGSSGTSGFGAGTSGSASGTSSASGTRTGGPGSTSGPGAPGSTGGPGGRGSASGSGTGRPGAPGSGGPGRPGGSSASAGATESTGVLGATAPGGTTSPGGTTAPGGGALGGLGERGEGGQRLSGANSRAGGLGTVSALATPDAPTTARTGQRDKAAPAKAPRKAHLVLRRIEPWSAMKFSFVVSVVCFLMLFVAVAVLYGVLSALGVFDSIVSTVTQLTVPDGNTSSGLDIQSWFEPGLILGYTALIGAVNVVLITAMCTLGAVIYNLAAEVVGGVEVTFSEAE
ncbi:DUF3566 domain-containing protein [Sphaerisporangium sp. TRM90804]|uniref:DUF3566 domain-containing protein n=1 Tax=Sphaerisporangium sp. TRM90804 TaxID=3031113 RepID=UPI0024499CD5|nr:DUF3566 domain-containing protein [Sphaerisporangium sp. TRM90804]MDH2425573.1 DUF3566 domain-containing protein [Sphaerisporangium sp. TRM90804]